MSRTGPLKIAVLVSGRGSNLQALIDACKDPAFPAEIVCVLSNRPDAYGLERARQAGIPAVVVDHKQYRDRPSFEAALNEALAPFAPELICLAGFMRILTENFTNHWRDRMINIHPSLLPAFRGLHTHERAIESGVRVSGCTVHYVRPEMDDGPIIIQAAAPVLPDDTPDTLAARILELEHKIYPEAVRLIALSKIRVEGQRVVFAEPYDHPGALINPEPGA